MSDAHPYGYCPTCGAPGVARERSIDGKDRCERGHAYPSREAIERPPAESGAPGGTGFRP